MESSRSFVPISVFSIFLVLFLASYLGSYVVLVNPDPDPVSYALGKVESLECPDYLLGGEWARWFYWPLEQLDRRLRPDVWWMC